MRKRYRAVLTEAFGAVGLWVVPTGIQIATGTINKTEAPGTARTATLQGNVQWFAQYRTTMTLSGRSAGSCRLDAGRDSANPTWGGTGSSRAQDNTYTETIIGGPLGQFQAVFGSTTNTNIAMDNYLVERV